MHYSILSLSSPVNVVYLCLVTEFYQKKLEIVIDERLKIPFMWLFCIELQSCIPLLTIHLQEGVHATDRLPTFSFTNLPIYV